MSKIAGKFRRRIIDPLRFWYSQTIKTRSKYFLDGKEYIYDNSKYNFSYANERSVEIPIFQDILSKQDSKSIILEVGNVISHYQPISHDVVDKYEKSQGVINEDVVDYKSKTKYDLIFSISTLEHVGWDEEKKDKRKILSSIKNLQKMLKKDGELWFSVPLGYNDFLDEIIEGNKLPIKSSLYLKRVSGFTNRWREIAKPKISDSEYGSPYENANIVMIGMCKK